MATANTHRFIVRSTPKRVEAGGLNIGFDAPNVLSSAGEQGRRRATQPIPRWIAGLAILSFLGACASVREARNPEQARYLAEAGSFPLEFSVALSDFDTAADRAHEWLGTDHGRTTTE